jgi:hypothetical protein
VSPYFAPSDSISPSISETQTIEVPTPAPKLAPCTDVTTASSFLQCLVNIIIPDAFVDGTAIDPSLAKFEALEWFIVNDTSSFRGSKSTTADAFLLNKELIQRFGVALLLYSLDLESSSNTTSCKLIGLCLPPLRSIAMGIKR